MKRPTMLRIGDWRVDPASGQISRDGETVKVEVRTMRLLLCLAENAGEVVSIDELISQVWSGIAVSSDSVYQAVTSLRRLLGDDPKQPRYIETVPRLGYRMIAAVSPWVEPAPDPMMDRSTVLDSRPPTIDAPVAGRRRRAGFTGVAFKGTGFLWPTAVALCLAAGVAFLVHEKAANDHATVATVTAPRLEKSIAVLPFLDLTEGMKQEEFADGMTEELIDKLSKISDFRVPSATSSFFFKNKQIPVADIARQLGVAYVLDGSVRKSGGRVRVAARLVRADNGYVVWSESYDRPFDDILMIQDDIAEQVAKALPASIKDRPGH